MTEVTVISTNKFCSKISENPKGNDSPLRKEPNTVYYSSEEKRQ